MSFVLGIDTSNYTTSVAAYNSKTNEMINLKQKLPVKAGEIGLRQSDAVFAHVKQLGGLITEISRQVESFVGVGVSTCPRNQQGSYMPCFLTGKMLADSLASINKIPAYYFSHQEGHFGSVIFGSQSASFLEKPFAAFHLSGGTTECVYVEKGEKHFFKANLLLNSLDLYAGQAVDRVGKMLGLSFPSGAELEQLALQSERQFKVKPFLEEGNPSISGLENQCKQMMLKGDDKKNVAKFVIDFLTEMLSGMSKQVRLIYPNIPILYAGGVMSNAIIREKMEKEFDGVFAAPEYSADNAAGIAYLTAKSLERNK